jgi:Kef-type K+ transport system membrane component KefB
VLLFAFLTGLHVDIDTVRGRGRAFAAISAASVVIPSSLGVVVGLLIGIRHPAALGARHDLIQFACAIGICLGVTALPVLGAILSEMDVLGSKIADLALGIAAVNDAALWLLLWGLVTSTEVVSPTKADILLPLLGLPAYCLVMWFVVRSLLRRALVPLVRDGALGESALAVVAACAIGSAVITQVMGLHYIFGAFIAGAIVPRTMRPSIADRLQTMTIGVLMPFFFILTGLRTKIDPSSSAFVEIVLVTTVVGIIGKLGGTATTALLFGETWSSALCLGTLVQTKGLMEVVVLMVLLERGVISSAAFSALTVTAVIGTALVMPLMRVLLPRTEGAEYARPSGRQIAAIVDHAALARATSAMRNLPIPLTPLPPRR